MIEPAPPRLSIWPTHPIGPGLSLARRLRGQGRHEAHAASDPLRQGRPSPQAFGRDVHHPGKRSPREVHGSRVRLGQRVVVLVRPNPNHEVGLGEAAAHGVTDHEAEATEHLLLNDIRALAQRGADA